jgi:hypothetical protein
MDDRLRFVSHEDVPERVRKETLRRLEESTDRYLNHPPARPIATPAAIAKELLLPEAETFGPLSKLNLPQLAEINGVTIGVEPFIEEWDANDRYNMLFRFHDRLSTLGLVASFEHESQHVLSTISFGGLPTLLLTEAKIASCKPTQLDPADLWEQVQQTINRLKPPMKIPWKKLTIQLEAYPSLIHHRFLSDRDRCMGSNVFEAQVSQLASKAARPELGELFMEALGKPRNWTHLEALTLSWEISKAGLGVDVYTFIDEATCLGFLGRDCLLKLAKKYAERYVQYAKKGSVEEAVAVLFEALGLTSTEYHRILRQDLNCAASATRGWAAKRFMVLSDGADFKMRYSPNDFRLGLKICSLIKLGGVPCINSTKYSPETLFHTMDFDVEAMLSFYVDWDLARKVEEPVKRYLKACAVGEEKPVHDMLVCPLFNAIQPPWCPGCSGKLKYALEKGAIRYEPGEGLNQNCPIIKEWIGEKNPLPNLS